MTKDAEKQKQAAPARGVGFVLISLIALGMSIALNDASSQSIVWSLPVGIGVFALFYKMSANSPITHRLPAPKTTVDHVIFWPVFAFFCYPAKYYPWSYIGLAAAMVGISAYGVIRQYIETRTGSARP